MTRLRRTFAALIGCHVILSSAAFKPDIHEEISETACVSIEKTIDSTTYKFQPKAIVEIRTANSKSDSVLGDFWNPEVHFDNEALPACSTRLINLREGVVKALVVGDAAPDGVEARKLLGQALHTLQDFYAHSNWVELVGWGFRSGYNQDLGRQVLRAPLRAVAFCPDDSDELARVNAITTGYFELELSWYLPVPLVLLDALKDVCFDYPSGKCRHGIDEVFFCNGINKDKDGKTGHGLAKSLASEGSKDFIQQILDDPAVVDNVDAVEALMGPQASLAFVIDDTGSMGDDIDAVIEAVEAFITTTSPTQFILVTFGDPHVSSAYKTSDRESFLYRLRSIYPSGGGDCAELAYTGLEVAINSMKQNSDVYLFTDADAKDAVKLNSVLFQAREKDIRINIVATGSCRRRRLRSLFTVDPSYESITSGTGGTLFRVQVSEIGSVFAVAAPRASGEIQVLLRAAGVSGGSVKVPVDSAVNLAIFTVQSPSFALTRPDGSQVMAADDGVLIVDAGDTAIVTVNEPEVGMWTLALTGPYNAIIEGRSNLELLDFSFVELLFGRELDYVPISGSPVAGESHTALVRMVGDFEAITYALVDESGAEIMALDFLPGTSPAPADSFMGTFDIPNEAFGVVARGEIVTGQPFQRFYPKIFNPVPFVTDLDYEFLLETGGGIIPAGASTTIQFAVENPSNGPITLSLGARDVLHFISSVTPSTVLLDPSKSASIAVEFTVPSCEDTDLIKDQVTFSATDGDQTNSKSMPLYISCSRPPDCGTSVTKTLWPPTGKMQDIAILEEANVTDPDGDPITLTINSIFQDEPVKGKGKRAPPDATGKGTAIASVRAERDGTGDGRVYKIDFTADDGNGGTCDGVFFVEVPHDQNGAPAVRGEFVYDSTQE